MTIKDIVKILNEWCKSKRLEEKREWGMIKVSIFDKKNVRRSDGRVEWTCEHGIGHTIWYPKGNTGVHSCDGCCKNIIIKEKHEGKKKEDKHDKKESE